MKTIKYLVLHCTDTPHDRHVTAQDIRNWHTLPKPKGNGWTRVGYSDMITLDGNLLNLTSWNTDPVIYGSEITNGAKGYNDVSRHLVYVGGKLNGKPHDTRTEDQKDLMEDYCRFMISLYSWIEIAGHCDLPGHNKTCPNFNVKEWLKEIGLEDFFIKK